MLHFKHRNWSSNSKSQHLCSIRKRTYKEVQMTVGPLLYESDRRQRSYSNCSQPSISLGACLNQVYHNAAQNVATPVNMFDSITVLFHGKQAQMVVGPLPCNRYNRYNRCNRLARNESIPTEVPTKSINSNNPSPYDTTVVL